MDMLIVLLILWGSALVGYLLRRWPQPWVSNLLTISIWLMLFAVGVEVGSNEVLTRSLGRLGAEALLITVLTTMSCCLGALLLWRCIQSKEDESYRGGRSAVQRLSLRGVWMTMRESMTICVCFAAGCVLGYWGVDRYVPDRASFYSLCVLLMCVGFGIGQNEEVRHGFKYIKRGFVLMPVVTIVATWVGALLTALLVRTHSLVDWMAVSSGFGYYSLSSMLITEMRDVELGTLALMYNVLREITTLLFAPLLLRLFGPLAPVSIGGATTADTTLPIISRVCGAQFVPVAIFHGLVVDLSVPFLVTLLCSM
jgi:uncharacterized membrane protein YbjE (DUF340 family)